MNGYLFGVVLSLCSSTVESIGYCMLRLYHLHDAGLSSASLFEGEGALFELPFGSGCDWFRNKPIWLWLGGIVCVMVGNALDFVSLGVTKESVVTIAGSCSLVVTAFLAPWILGETLTRQDTSACALIVVGIICTVVSSSTKDRDWSIDRILAQYAKPGVVAMVCCMFLVTFVCMIILALDYYRRRRAMVRGGHTSVAAPQRGFIGFVYCFLSAFVGNFTVVLGKANAVLLFSILGGIDHHSHPLAYALFCMFLLFVPLELWLIDASLSVNDSLYHVPVFYVCWILGSIVTGAVFYDEMANFTLWRWLLFFSGVCILVAGVALINASSRKKQAALEHNAALYEREMGCVDVWDGVSSKKCGGEGGEGAGGLVGVSGKGSGKVCDAKGGDQVVVAYPVAGEVSINETKKRRRSSVCSDGGSIMYETAKDVSDNDSGGSGGPGEGIIGFALSCQHGEELIGIPVAK